MEWLLDSDPAIRWQVLRDLVHAPAEVIAAERARVATEGWGARLLAMQGEDGQWAGGACFPAPSYDLAGETEGQPWISTLPTVQLLYDFGIDPRSDQVSRAVALVRDRCRWEHAGQPFFSGEVEPCINGRTVTLGIYFGQDVEAIVRRLLREQLEDGGARRSRPRSTSWKDYWPTNAQRVALQNPLRHGGGVRSTSSNESCSDVRARAKLSILYGCNSHFQSAGNTTYCVPSTTFVQPGMGRTREWTKRWICSDPRGYPMAHGCWRIHTQGRSILRSKKATDGPAGGTRCERYASSAGLKNPLPESSSARVCRSIPTSRTVLTNLLINFALEASISPGCHVRS
jgi:hypothetical protein